MTSNSPTWRCLPVPAEHSPPRRLSSTHISDSAPLRVDDEKPKRKRRKRTRYATIQRKINAVARDRQKAWTTTGQPALTARLSDDLTDLFEDLREHTDWQKRHDLPFQKDRPGESLR